MKKAIKNQGESQFKYLLGLYLKQHNVSCNEHVTAHLDEDVLSALVEERLNLFDHLSVASHLVECSLCRHSTFELFRLANHFNFDENLLSMAKSKIEPNLFHEFCTALKAKVFTSNGSTVFAHEESTDSDKQNIEE